MDRRLLLSLIAGTVAIPSFVKAVPLPPPQPHRLNLYNQHTGETFSGIYRDDNGPIPSAMEDLSTFLRDFHCGEQIGIDVGVIDFLSGVMEAAGQRKATILSAYRTPETNEKLCKSGFGAAENSQHLYGRALDVHFGENLADAMKAARAMQRGGVGWYPHSSFMHIDTGPVRNWDLNHKGLGKALVGKRRVHFDKHGVVVDRHGRPIGGQAAKARAVVGKPAGKIAGGRTPVEHPTTVRGRLAKLRQLARLEHLARKH
jgi:uncharacterized protein YcbK (DUF882 family)